MRNFLAVGVLASLFVLLTMWVTLNHDTTKLALAPEISAVSEKRTNGVLDFQAIDAKPLGTAQIIGNYSVLIKDRKIVDLNSCPADQSCNVAIRRSALEYTVVFDLSTMNLGDEGYSNFLAKDLGNNYLTMTDSENISYVMQDLGGIPSKSVRFLISDASKKYTIGYQSAAMKINNVKAVVWQGQ